MQKFMKRFSCPRCSSYLTPYAPPKGGRFHGCKTCFAEGKKFNVEFDPPHKAYGDVAEDYGIRGVSQVVQIVPTKYYAKELQRQESYRDILIDSWNLQQNFLELRSKILPRVQTLGGEYKKKTLDDIRHDFMLLSMGSISDV